MIHKRFAPRNFLRGGVLLFGVVVFALANSFAWVATVPSVSAAPGINRQIPFQGRVVNLNGTTIVAGSYSFTFSLYTQPTGGSAIWTETKTLSVTNSIFGTNLGSSTAIPGTVDFNQNQLYLGINFNGDGEMTPRIEIAAVPQAINAEKVGGLTVTNTTGTLTIPNSATVSFGASFTTSANPLSLVTTGATSVTLPTTGVLATLSGVETFANKTLGVTTFTGNLTPSGSVDLGATGNRFANLYVATADATNLTVSGTSSLGTVTGGTWQGSVIAAQYGGTGLNTSAATGIPVLAGGTWSVLANGSNTQCLVISGGVPTWSSCAASGTVTGTGVAGQLSYWDTNATLANAAGLTWNAGASQLGIGTASTIAPLTVRRASSGIVLAVRNTADSATVLSVNDTGDITGNSLAVGAGLTVSGGTVSLPAGEIGNTELANSSLTVSAGTNLSGGGAVSLGGSTTLNVVGNPSFATSVTAPTINATTSLQLNGVSVNTSGTLSNVAYLAQANAFTAGLSITSATTPQLSVRNDASNRLDVSTSATGQTTLTAVGTNPDIILDASATGGDISLVSPSGSFGITASGAIAINGAGGGINIASNGAISIDNTGTQPLTLDVSSIDVVNGANITGDGTSSITGFIWGGTTISPTAGGTGLTSYVTGDILYASATDTLARRAIGSNGDCLVVSSGIPTWGSCAQSSNTLQAAYGNGNTIALTDARDFALTLANTTTDSNVIFNIATGSTGRFAVQNNGTDVFEVDANGTTITSGGLTVTAGTISLPAGEIGNTELANSSLTVSAGTGLSGGGVVSLGGSTSISLPNVGSANTYGSASQVPVFATDAQGRITGVTPTNIALAASAITTGQIAPIRGGTGFDSSSSTGLPYISSGAWSAISNGSNNQCLVISGGVPTWGSCSAGGGVTGSGSAGTLTYWDTNTTIASASGLNFASGALAIGTATTTNGTFTVTRGTAGIAMAVRNTADSATTFSVSDTGAIIGTSLGLGSGTITSGLINSQTISSAANFTGSLTVANGLTVTAGTVSLPNGSIDNAELANASLTVTAGTNLSGGGSVSLGGSTTLNIVDNPTFSGIVTATGAGIGLNVITNAYIEGSLRVDSGINNENSGITNAGTISGATISGASNTLTNIGNGSLTNSSLTITAGTNLSGGGSVSLGGSTTLDIVSNPTFTGLITGSNTGGTALALTGAPGASGTQSLLRLGNAIVGGDADGTFIGLNAISGYTGNLVDLQLNGVSEFSINEAGNVVAGNISAGTLTAGTYNGQTISSAANFTGSLTVANGFTVTTGAVSLPAGSIANAALANSSITVTAGTGLSGGGSVALGSSVSLSLPNVGSIGTYGSATQVPVFTTDAQGRITGVTNTTIAGIDAGLLDGLDSTDFLRSTATTTFSGTNTRTLNVTSSLAAGARSSALLNITQADNATNNSSAALLNIVNSDDGSTGSPLTITNVVGGSGITITTPTSVGVVNGDSLSLTNTVSAYSLVLDPERLLISPQAADPFVIDNYYDGISTLSLVNSYLAGTVNLDLTDGNLTTAGTTRLTNGGVLQNVTYNGGVIGAQYGGTGQSSYAVGDILYASGTTALSKLVAGTNGQCLVLASGVPSWSSCATAAVTLQASYDNGNTIALTNARNLGFTLQDTATDPSFLINIATGSTGRFAVQDNGTDVLAVTSSNTSFNAGAAVISNGNFFGAGLSNLSTGDNAYLQVLATGALVTRNIADANAALTVQQLNASSTGNILELKNDSTTPLTISRTGTIATAGGYTQSGTTANTFTGVTTLSAAGTALSVTNNASIGGQLSLGGQLIQRLTGTAANPVERLAFGRSLLGIQTQDEALQNFGAIWTPRDSSRNWTRVAMSSDGSRQTAIAPFDQIYTSSDFGATWVARDSSRNWTSVAMSSDGSRQTATVDGGQIYTSTDFGASWVARDSSRNWQGVAMSADGSRQTATVFPGQIYTSTDFGATWIARDSSRNWYGVAMSADGSRQTATVYGGQIYTSSDFGITWAARDSSRNWRGLAMSADGSRQTATVYGGQIYTSTDFGATWAARDSSREWRGVAISADGSRQSAVVSGFGPGQIYTSSDFGVSWTARDSARAWEDVAMSADGSRQTATEASGQIYTSVTEKTTLLANLSINPDASYTGNLLAVQLGGSARLTVANSGATTIAAGGLTVSAGGAAITGTTTVSGGVISLNTSSNFATNINTGTSNGAVTIGGGSGTFALNSTALDIATTGAVTGILSLSQATGSWGLDSSGQISSNASSGAVPFSANFAANGGQFVAGVTPAAATTAALFRGGSRTFTGSANGTAFGANFTTGFAGDFLNMLVNDVSILRVTAAGNITTSGTFAVTGQITGSTGLTVTGGIANINASSNFATNINTGTSNGAVTIGGGSGTFALDSTALDISTAGALTGVTGITSSGSYTQSGSSTNTLTGATTFSNSGVAINISGGRQTITNTDGVNYALSVTHNGGSVTRNGLLVTSSGTSDTTTALRVETGTVTDAFTIGGTGNTAIGTALVANNRLVIRGAGATSATNSLLVEDSAGTDIFTVRNDSMLLSAAGYTQSGTGANTFSGVSSFTGGRIALSGNRSIPLWGISGAGLTVAAATYTNTSSLSGASVGSTAINVIGQPTVAATNTNVTSSPSTLRIDGPPIAGTNAINDAAYSLLINDGAPISGTFGFGLRVFAPTGASENIAAAFTGGSVGIGTSTSLESSLVVRGAGTTSATTSLTVEDSAGTDILTVRNDGVLLVGGGYTQSGTTANTFTGATTLSAAGTALSVTNNASIGGTLAVTGATTFGGDVSFNNAGKLSLYNNDNTNYYYLDNPGATGATNSVLRILQGNVGEAARFGANGAFGLGTSTLTSLLNVGTSAAFQVNAAGAIAAVTGITSSGGFTQSGSASNTFTGALNVTSGAAVISNASGSTALSVTSATNRSDVILSGAAGNFRMLQMQTAGLLRWSTYTTGETESGSNAGSNFGIARYDDAGAYLADAFTINRATGATVITGPTQLTASGTSLEVINSASFNGGNAVISNGNFFGAGLSNLSTGDNAYLQVLATGALVTRNIADANAALTVQQLNASSTGDILQLRNNSSTVLSVSRTGNLALGVVGSSSGTIALNGSTSGTVTIQPQAAAGTYNFNLPTTAGTSGFVLTSAGGASAPMTWTDPAALSVRWNSIANPTGNQSLSMGTNTTSWNYATGTGSNDLFNLTTDASANGTGSLLNIQTGASSTVNPVRIRAGSVESLFVNDSGNVGIGTTTPGSNKLAISTNGTSLLTLTHDATNGLIGTSAGALNLRPASGIVALNTTATQNRLRVFGSGGSNYIELTNDNTNSIISSSAGELQLQGSGTNQFILGSTGSAMNLIFEESSTISGQGTNTITLGQSGDIFNLNASGVTYNVGTLTSTGATLATTNTGNVAFTINGPAGLTANLLNLAVNGSNRLTVTTAGALSTVSSLTSTVTGANALALTGAPLASTTASLLQLGGTITGGSASGTFIGINTAGGFSGNLVDFQINGTNVLRVNAAGLTTAASFVTSTATADAFVASSTAPTASATSSLLRLGNALAVGSSAGNFIGVNAGSGFTGNFLDLEKNGVEVVSITADAQFNLTGEAIASTSWSQVSSAGLGVATNTAIPSAVTFNDGLYYATTNTTLGTQVYRSTNGTSWSLVNTSGFGSASNTSSVLTASGGTLFAATTNTVTGVQVWSSTDGSTWTQVNISGFGSAARTTTTAITSFGGAAYVSTGNGETFRSFNGTNWTLASDLGGSNGTGVRTFFTAQGFLYAGSSASSGGGILQRSSNGTTWSTVGSAGLGDTNNSEISIGMYANGAYYFGTRNAVNGTKVYRSYDLSSFTQVNTNGFGTSINQVSSSIVAYNGGFYVGTTNNTNGSQLFYSGTGSSWAQVNSNGFGSSSSTAALTAVNYNGRLLVSVSNSSGVQVWTAQTGVIRSTTGGIAVKSAQIGDVQIENATIKGVSELNAGTISAQSIGVRNLQVADGMAVNSSPTFTGNLAEYRANDATVLSTSVSGATRLSPWNFTSVLQTTTAEANYTDITSSANSTTAYNIYRNSAALNDRTYFGFTDSAFTAITYSETSGSGGATSFEVCTALTSGVCTTWSAISGGSDTTSALTASGAVSWTNTLTKGTVNGVNAFWVRLTVTSGMSVQANGRVVLRSFENGSTVSSGVAFLLQANSTSSAPSWSSGGTYFGVLAETSFAGNFIDLRTVASSLFRVSGTGGVTIAPNSVSTTPLTVSRIGSQTADTIIIGSVFVVDTTGKLASSESLPGVPMVGVDPNSGATRGDLTSSAGPLRPFAGAGLTLNISAGAAYTADNYTSGSRTTVRRCVIPSDTTIAMTASTTEYVYLIASTTDTTTGKQCTVAKNATLPTFNAQYPVLVLAKVVSGASITSVADTRFFIGSTLVYAVSTSSVEPGSIVVQNTGVDNQVDDSNSAATTGVAGITAVGNTASGIFILNKSGTAWAQAVSGAARGVCAGTSTTTGSVNNISAAVTACAGRVMTNAASATPAVLVQISPN